MASIVVEEGQYMKLLRLTYKLNNANVADKNIKIIR